MRAAGRRSACYGDQSNHCRDAGGSQVMRVEQEIALHGSFRNPEFNM